MQVNPLVSVCECHKYFSALADVCLGAMLVRALGNKCISICEE